MIQFKKSVKGIKGKSKESEKIIFKQQKLEVIDPKINQTFKKLVLKRESNIQNERSLQLLYYRIFLKYQTITNNCMPMNLKNQFSNNRMCVCAQLCLTLCSPMYCSLPGSSAHRIFQARILGWVAISNSRGSSQLRD